MIAVVVVMLLAVVVSGCSKPASYQSAMPSGPAKMAGGSKMMASNDASPDIPPCYECSGKGKAPVVEGSATMHGATQVVNVSIQNGCYVPNKIAAKAGVPVRVVFTGKTKDCVGKPKFGLLNKQIDIRTTGTGAIDLGVLTAGSYEFSCGMGATGGSIIVQ